MALGERGKELWGEKREEGKGLGPADLRLLRGK